jgi:nitroreductase
MAQHHDKIAHMEFSDVLSRRHMVRNYKDQSIDDDALARIADAALRAPSAGNSRAIGVVVVTDERIKSDIAGLADEASYVAAGFDPWISRAPAHIVISVSEQVYRNRYSEPDKLGPDGQQIEWPIPYWWVDAGAAMMAVLLAVVNEGLAAGFLGVHSVPDLASRLGFPADHIPIGVLTVGHPAEDRRSGSLDRPLLPRSAVIHQDQWTNHQRT